MSKEGIDYQPVAVKAWTAMSIVFSVVLLLLFIFGNHFLNAGQVVWDFLRWLNSPII